MKFFLDDLGKESRKVAPFAGAWIEIMSESKPAMVSLVAPFAGAWIEISNPCKNNQRNTVAPFAGAWIEIL